MKTAKKTAQKTAPKTAQKTAPKAGKRPDFRVVIKTVDGEFVPLLAYWVDPDTGLPRGGLDARVRALRVATRDGATVTITRGGDGRHRGGFVNLYVDADAASAASDDEDDIPF